jgi:hypothetical protein
MYQTFRQRLQRELTLVVEYSRLVRRTPVKFLRQALRDYYLRFSGAAPSWQLVNIAFRIIDDIADGERELVSGFASFPALIDQARRQVIDRTPPTGSTLLELLDDALCGVEQLERRKGETRESFVGLLDAMLVEYRRRVDLEVLPKQSLIEIHRASSVHALNISLICLGSQNRAVDVPALAEFIGRMGALRDLEHELALGIINIPRGVLPDDCRVDELIIHPESIRRMQSVVDWMRAEAHDGLQLAEQLRGGQLDAWAERVTRGQVALYLRYAQQRFPSPTLEPGRS